MDIRLLGLVLRSGGYNQDKIDKYIKEYMDITAFAFMEGLVEVVDEKDMVEEKKRIVDALNEIKGFYSDLSMADDEKGRKLEDDFSQIIKDIGADEETKNQIIEKFRVKLDKIDNQVATDVMSSLSEDKKQHVVKVLQDSIDEYEKNKEL